MQRNRQTSLVKTASRLFLAFLSTVFLFSFIVLLTFRLTLFSENYISKQAEKTGYYTEVLKEVNQQISNNALGSNIPLGTLNDVVSKKMVEKDINNYFHAMYSTKGEKYTLDSEKQISTNIKEKVQQYATEKQIALTPETEKAIEEMTKQSLRIYKGHIELPFLLGFGQRVVNYKSTLLLFMAISGVIWGGLSAFLFVSLRGYLHRLFRYWSYIFSGSGLMLLIVPIYLLNYGGINRLGIQSKALYHFIYAYLTNLLWLFIWFGIIAIILGIGSAIFSEYKRKKLFSGD